MDDDIDTKADEESDGIGSQSTTQPSEPSQPSQSSEAVKEITYATLADMKKTNLSLPSSRSSTKASPKSNAPRVKYEDIDFKATEAGVHTQCVV